MLAHLPDDAKVQRVCSSYGTTSIRVKPADMHITRKADSGTDGQQRLPGSGPRYLAPVNMDVTGDVVLLFGEDHLVDAAWHALKAADCGSEKLVLKLGESAGRLVNAAQLKTCTEVSGAKVSNETPLDAIAAVYRHGVGSSTCVCFLRSPTDLELLS